MNNKINISLSILLLNDLLNTNVIDKDVYDKAVKKILSEEDNMKAA